tara:strand:+ start:210 stop:362 length:153 start_codon:yes stop_codon:yes gene_type:complete
MIPFNYLRKGEGKLASDNHGITLFAEKRKDKIIQEQLERERIKDDDKSTK